APNPGQRLRERFVRFTDKDTPANVVMGVALPTGDAAFTVYGVGLDIAAQLPDDLDKLELYQIQPQLQSGVLAATRATLVLGYYGPGWYYIQVGSTDSSVKRIDFMPVNLGITPST
ncbi:MAG: hypothetical protein GWN58_39735, partial [Anaerolineae bacterium]|nr:hypothetical protein [Anaerolineae bacterium]